VWKRGAGAEKSGPDRATRATKRPIFGLAVGESSCLLLDATVGTGVRRVSAMALGRASGHASRFDCRALSPSAASAWEDSFMAAFPPHVTAALLRNSCPMRVKGGEVLYSGPECGDTAVLALVVDGLVRTDIHAESGRRVTVRYGWPGDVVGLTAAVLAGLDDPDDRDRRSADCQHRLEIEAVRDTTVLKLGTGTFLKFAQTEATVACAVATSLAHLTAETEQILEDRLFQSIRARVARHLLDLAVLRDGVLVVAEGHKETAAAIGSVREVVSRTLVRMRDEGIVDRSASETILLDPAALHEIAAEG
jgi:CRP/FNR family transcriptional regulator, cyclic AMP receptor protein